MHGKQARALVEPVQEESFGETLHEDGRGNRSNCLNTHIDSHDVVTVSDDPKHTIATIGCRDMIIVRTADATLVCPASQAERVKDLASQVDKNLQ